MTNTKGNCAATSTSIDGRRYSRFRKSSNGKRGDKVMRNVVDIPQLEKFVMEGLFWSDTPVLQTISAHKGCVPECFDKIKAALERAMPCSEEYLRLYDAYLETVTLARQRRVVVPRTESIAARSPWFPAWTAGYFRASPAP